MDSIQYLHVKRTIEFIAHILVIIGALNWGLIGIFGVNIVTVLSKYTTPMIQPFIYGLVGLSGLYLLFRRDYYLPFLGETVFPCDPLTEKVPEKANTTVEVTVRPNANVVFWAAEEGADEIVGNPWKAYMRYANSGVVRADAKGRAVLRVRRPVSYRVPPMGRILDQHIHYRVCGESGILGRIETVSI
jgi:uncharacterized membrane protein YuzA (DUF378 family)